MSKQDGVTNSTHECLESSRDEETFETDFGRISGRKPDGKENKAFQTFFKNQ